MVYFGLDSIILKFGLLVNHNLTLARVIPVVVGSELHRDYFFASFNLLSENQHALGLVRFLFAFLFIFFILSFQKTDPVSE